MRPQFIAWFCAASLFAPGLALAQQTAPEMPIPPPSAKTAPPEVIAPAPGTGGASGSGVITPPRVDPGIAVKPPADAQQSMPIVPPPGAPGANPNVVPK